MSNCTTDELITFYTAPFDKAIIVDIPDLEIVFNGRRDFPYDVRVRGELIACAVSYHSGDAVISDALVACPDCGDVVLFWCHACADDRLIKLAAQTRRAVFERGRAAYARWIDQHYGVEPWSEVA